VQRGTLLLPQTDVVERRLPLNESLVAGWRRMLSTPLAEPDVMHRRPVIYTCADMSSVLLMRPYYSRITRLAHPSVCPFVCPVRARNSKITNVENENWRRRSPGYE